MVPYMQLVVILSFFCKLPQAIQLAGNSSQQMSTVSLTACVQKPGSLHANCNFLNLISVPEDLFENIRSLDMSYNDVEILRNTSLRRYRLLAELDFIFNKIKIIESGTFHDLHQLQELRLCFNEGISLHNFTSFSLNYLTDLDLSYCNLTFVPGELFVKLPRLETIQLRGNYLQTFNITSCTSKHLLRIELNDNLIRMLTPNTFSLACKSEYLDLSRNPISVVNPQTVALLSVQRLLFYVTTLSIKQWRNVILGISRSTIREIDEITLDTIPNGFFDPLWDHFLTKLVLHIGKESSISAQTFQGLNNVRELIVYHKQMRVVQPSFFNNMNGLRVLDLVGNHINTLDTDHDTWDVGIRELYLSDNGLKEINPYSLQGLENLTILDLSDNGELVTFNITSFTGLKSLEILYLRECEIKMLALHLPELKEFYFSYRADVFHYKTGPFLPGHTFVYTQKLQNLTITNSMNVVNLVCKIGRRELFLFDGLKQLRSLTLYHNEFIYLPDGIFDQLTMLQELDMQSCHITSLGTKLFERLINLRLLYLDGNDLKRLPPLNNLYELTQLNLDRNELIELPNFHNMSSLTLLNVEDNFLTTLNLSTFGNLGASKMHISLSGNPIVCSCELQWFIEWMNGPGQIIDRDFVICSTAPETIISLRGKKITLFEPEKLCTTINAILISAVTLSSLVLIALVIFTFHFRWYLKYKFFLLKLAVLGYNEIQDGQDPQDFDYDLDVIYSDQDEAWLQIHLTPILEERLQHFNRNAIGDDSLPLGMYYLDAIHYVMERSYKIVILVSRAAVQTHLFLIKFRMAHDLVTEQQIENVIVVFLEDIPDDEMPFVLRLYLSNRRPYLNWTQDEEGMKYFWDQFEKLSK